MKKKVPAYNGTLRDHTIMCPYCISECSGIRIFGKRIKSIAFSTDVAIIKNINADAIIAVYPFTPQAAISQSIISISDVPVFVGVGGGLTGGKRSVRLALQAEHQGAYGVVVNAPIADEVITEIKRDDCFGSHGCPPQTGGGSRYFKCIRRCRHRIDGSRDPEGVSGRCHYRDRRTDERIDFGDDRGRSQCDHVHAAVQRRAVCADDEKIQGDQSLIIQKAGPKRKHNFLFGPVFYFMR